MDREVWYEIEYSRKGENDWFTTGNRADSEESARYTMGGLQYMSLRAEFEHRIVRKILTTEVVDQD